jgi:hypothetical protein
MNLPQSLGGIGMRAKSFYLVPLWIFVFLFILISCDHFIENNPVGDNIKQSGITNETVSKTAGSTVHQSSNVYRFADGTPVDNASAALLRNASGLKMTIHTNDLPAGDTFTIWWVVFNFPENCEHPIEGLAACSEEDLFIEAVGATVLYAAGNIAGGNGKSNFGSSLRSNDLSGCQAPFDEFGLCREGLVNSYGAEVHFVVRTHGPKIPGMVNQQIGTFAGGCTPETSFGAGDGPIECEDLQFGIFLANNS